MRSHGLTTQEAAQGAVFLSCHPGLHPGGTDREASDVPTSAPTLVIPRLSDSRLPSGCAVLSHCGLDYLAACFLSCL